MGFDGECVFQHSLSGRNLRAFLPQALNKDLYGLPEGDTASATG